MPGITPSQQAAIEAEGNVLVSAGAGSGKTQTLVDRCVHRIVHPENPTRVDAMLVVTFTNAAAQEMRARIRSTLEARFQMSPDNRFLAEQLGLLDSAPIGTLHSFCVRLIREHFYELGLDPLVIVAEESHAATLARHTLQGLLLKHFQTTPSESNQVQALILDLGDGREDMIADLILKIHHHAQSLPDPRGWLRQQLELAQSPTPPGWEDLLQSAFHSLRATWIQGLEAVAQDNVQACAKHFRQAGPNPSRTAIHLCLESLLLETTRWKRGEVTEFKKPLEKLFDAAAFLLAASKPSTSSPDPFTDDWLLLRPRIQTLVECVIEFERDFSRAKREQGLVDFHDLEQFALDLLWDRTRHRPTALATQIQARFQYVFVDEYQDINQAQDQIIQAVASPRGNRFLVGDIKQSIYRFRQADPRIFHSYLDSWSPRPLHAPHNPPPTPGTVLELRENFRSHESILDFVNALFSYLMTPDRGGIPYAQSGTLRFGGGEAMASRSTAQSPSPRVEVLLVNATDESPDTAPAASTSTVPQPRVSSAELEATAIAMRMTQLHASQTLVWDRALQTHRPCQWRDMVVLARSLQAQAGAFAKAFSQADIPLEAQRSGFYQEIEVQDVLNLLKVLDNPLQDIPLASVLRSAFASFSPDEFAALRSHLPKGALWTALASLAHATTPRVPLPEPLLAAFQSAQLKARTLHEQILRWRTSLQTTELSQALASVLEEVHYHDWLACQSRPSQRLANLRKLLAMTGEFDTFRRQGLYRFLRLITNHELTGYDPGPAPDASQNAVRLITVHSSKGLQFPIVFLAGLSRSFNFSDTTQRIILSSDPQLGLTGQVKPPGFKQHYPTLPFWIARQQERIETLNEELRLLYVALTRPADQLFLVAQYPSESAAEKWVTQVDSTAHPHEWAQAKCCMDWIGPALSQIIHQPDWFLATPSEHPLVRWQTVTPSIATPSQPPTRSETSPPPDLLSTPKSASALADQIESVQFLYPFQPATLEPAKSTVSTIRRRWLQSDDDTVQASNLPPFPKPNPTAPHGPFSHPSLNAAEVGVAHHLFLQHVDLDSTSNPTTLQNEAQRLTALRILSSEQAQCLNWNVLSDFWNSELGLHLKRNVDHLRRELPFTAAFRPDELQLPPAIDDFIVVQGIVDAALILPEEIHLLDFKTGQVTSTSLPDEVQRYSTQLHLYALALQRIYQRPVTRLWIHFLSAQVTVPIPAPGAPKPRGTTSNHAGTPQ